MKKIALLVGLVLVASVGAFYLGRQTAPEQPQSEVTQIVDTAHGDTGTGEEGLIEDAESLLEEDAVDIIDDVTMYTFFESAFEHGEFIRSIQNNKDTLQDELDNLAAFQTQTLKFKEGYQDEYIEWRNEKLEAQMKVEEKEPEKAPEKVPEKAPSSETQQKPSGGNTNSSGNSGGTDNNSSGTAGGNNPQTSEFNPSKDSGITDEDYELIENHLKNEGITIGGCGD